ncbi:hypothetical protein [Corticicoccus populi]|uniref:DUF998 domain-containing protein n=1 Tax=Corticicoccus populi TaxID=1812821 RepID=A0ABW5WWF1_9STAP
MTHFKNNDKLRTLYTIFKIFIVSITAIFHREKALAITGLLGFLIAAFSAMYIYLQGAVIPPEGNIENVFSFTAAIGIFLLSIAAILPLASFSNQHRKIIRWLFVTIILYCYIIETIQNFRGLNPRFSEMGGIIDTIAGILFGIVSIALVILGIILTIQFLKMNTPLSRPILIIGIRYALVSVFIANLAGIMMIILQDRLFGESGNFIILHGVGFHSLQTLIIMAWILERSKQYLKRQRFFLHTGSIAWLMALLFIALGTGLGISMSEVNLFLIATVTCLSIWLFVFVWSIAGWYREILPNKV